MTKAILVDDTLSVSRKVMHALVNKLRRAYTTTKIVKTTSVIYYTFMVNYLRNHKITNIKVVLT